MADATITRIEGRRANAESLASGLEQWQKDHREAMAVRGLEGVIADALALAESSFRLLADLERLLWNQQLTVPFVVGDYLRMLFSSLVRLFDNLEMLASAGRQHGFDIDGDQSLTEKAQEARRQKSLLTTNWPRVDADMQARAMADHQSGRTLTPEEAIRELLDDAASGDR